MGKGSKQRIVHMGVKTQKTMWHYLMLRSEIPSKNEAIWVTTKGLPLSASGIQQMIVKLGKRLGIGLSPHKLRHNFALYYLRNGGDVFTLQTLLGHSTLEIVKRYLGSLTIEDAINSHKMCSPADNIKA
jgi:site-specific recombinase XerD